MYEPDPPELIDAIHRLRGQTGRSFMECRAALEICGMDEKLACGYLAFNGLAVNVKPREGETQDAAYRRWVLSQAQDLVDTLSV